MAEDIKNENIKNEKTKGKNLTEKIRDNPWIASTFIFAFIAVILLVLSLKGGITGNVISEKDIGQKAVEFINTQLLQGQGNVTLDSVNDKGNYYEVVVNYNGKKVPTQFTKDGEYFIEGLVSLTAQATSQQTTPKEVPKSDKPKVELFVMSFCPYGNRAEDTMLPVYNLLKDKVDWNVNYIVSVSGNSVDSLHGQPEVDEDEREACVLSEYSMDKWWKFIIYVNNNCGSDGSCWETAAKNVGLDVNKIKTCVQNKGLDLMKANEEASNSAGASGSPTLLINGVESTAVYQYGNSEAYKQAICSAFNTAPSECSQKSLGSSNQTSTTSAASCG